MLNCPLCGFPGGERKGAIRNSKHQCDLQRKERSSRNGLQEERQGSSLMFPFTTSLAFFFVSAPLLPLDLGIITQLTAFNSCISCKSLCSSVKFPLKAHGVLVGQASQPLGVRRSKKASGMDSSSLSTQGPFCTEVLADFNAPALQGIDLKQQGQSWEEFRC